MLDDDGHLDADLLGRSLGECDLILVAEQHDSGTTMLRIARLCIHERLADDPLRIALHAREHALVCDLGPTRATLASSLRIGLAVNVDQDVEGSAL